MDDLQARAIRLIEPLIPPDAQDRVERTIKQFNNVVREHIRTETGLRLADSQSTGTIPIRVVAGFPAKLAELIDRHQDRVLWRLIIGQPKLGGIVEGLNFLLPDWPEFERWLNLPSVAIGSEPALMRTRDVAVALQGLAVTKKVLDELKEIHEDILGVYRFATRVGGSIEIYWMANALVAGALGVRVEDLAVVALAHELAHGYTHQGRDIDGLSWADDGFARSALEVKEGLAQFYTAVVAERLGSRAPGIFAAYAKLLELQTGPYLVHTQWLDGTRRQRGETVRFVLLQARNYGVVTHEKWRGLLTETSQRLKPGAAPGSGSSGHAM